MNDVVLDPIEMRWSLIVMKPSGPFERLQSRPVPTSVMLLTPNGRALPAQRVPHERVANRPAAAVDRFDVRVIHLNERLVPAKEHSAGDQAHTESVPARLGEGDDPCQLRYACKS